MRKRFRVLRSLIHEAVVKNDVLGLKSPSIASQLFQRSYAPVRMTSDDAPRPEAFAAMRSADKVAAFMAWLREMQDQNILEIQTGSAAWAANQSWQNVYIQSAYRKGVRDAATEMERAGARVLPSYIDAAFDRPIHADRVGLVYTRAFSDLRGITEVMDQQISRVLAQGLAEGIGPMLMARQMVDRVDKIGITRARVLARTETIRAHADASLNSYREAELEGVVLRAEWLLGTNPCPECQAAADKGDYTISEAEGLIPLHPNCVCSWGVDVRLPDGTVLQ